MTPTRILQQALELLLNFERPARVVGLSMKTIRAAVEALIARPASDLTSRTRSQHSAASGVVQAMCAWLW
jgi:hypothetical protein